MEETWKTLTSPAWWVTAVLFGLLVNLCSAYLKSPLDRIGGQIWSSWNSRTRRAQEEHRARIELLKCDSSLQFHVLLEALSLRTQAQAWLTAAAVAAIIFSVEMQFLLTGFVVSAVGQTKPAQRFDGSAYLLIGAVTCVVVAAWKSSRAGYREQLVRESRSSGVGGV